MRPLALTPRRIVKRGAAAWLDPSSNLAFHGSLSIISPHGETLPHGAHPRVFLRAYSGDAPCLRPNPASLWEQLSSLRVPPRRLPTPTFTPPTIFNVTDTGAWASTTPGMSMRGPSSTMRAPTSIAPSGDLRPGDGESMRQMALAGTGVARLARYHVGANLAAGRLIPLLKNHDSDAVEDIHAVFVGPGHHVPARVRVLLDFLAKRVAQDLPAGRRCLG